MAVGSSAMATTPYLVKLASCILVFVCSVRDVLAADPAPKFLVISAPRLSKVVYMKLGDEGKPEHHPLIEDGLRTPQGLAIDQQRKKLFVADPDSKKIFSYACLFKDGKMQTDGRQIVAVNNVESRWVAVDGAGNVFFSVERENAIQKVSADKLLRGEATPTTLYSGVSISQVSAPGGVAVDNFNVFWSNKAVGTIVGSVVKGFETPPETNVAGSVKPVAKNAVKVYGVCLVNDNVFYTDHQYAVYGVKKIGGEITTISNKLIQPRGITWDGDGTVYVADKGGNAVYSFPGNMENISPQALVKTVDFEDAFGVAVVSGAHHFAATSSILLSVLSVMYMFQ
eukprot:gnl/MRDRNA2_/MRDRNA2_98616_c0_seq1.p1 gnl/MRDRNA2_/MRDRNA2_98616_c0~~gnl/MRDRNA2_/MRDRNA2_98616_c0_seq1.p1  ORF type:complete len:340 (-),score=60.36 gnl/MRDRNA2_/MRDRNA2_98616_c0_seq1:11-1030(-)